MAQADVEVLSGGLGTLDMRAEDRTTSTIAATLKEGEVVKRGGTGGNFATLLLTGDPEIGTDIFLGVVSRESTELSAEDGRVDVEMVMLGTRLRAKATTATNIDTQAELDDILLDFVTFDGPAAVNTATFNYTINENEGDDPNVHGLVIVGGNIVKGTLDVYVSGATLFESTV